MLERLARREISPQEALRLLKQGGLPDEPASESDSPLPPLPPPDGRHAAARGGVAIIGMSGRFPGAKNYEELWRLLADGRSAVTEVPAERWDVDEHCGAEVDERQRIRTARGGYLEDVDKFDPLFFRMTGREAERCDPQHRLFMEECWRALEDAGYDPESLAGRRVGVFAGANSGDYLQKLQQRGVALDALSSVGNTSSVLAARIAYHLNLKGPCVTVDTACSSSLVAAHLGCQSLLTGESELVLAGGVFVGTTALFHQMCSRTGMLSPRGECRAFDAGGDGFVLGEAVGVVVLKPLEAALRDGDHIHGVIRGSGVNQDGKSNGITAPSARSQAELELRVYEQAGVNPADITYVEAHGTGTQLGDPIEVEALTAAFRHYTERNGYCALGSVKTNFGHCTFAAGVVGLIKVLLCLRHRQLVPSLNFETPNPQVSFPQTPFYVNTRLVEWEDGGRPARLAAVSSFGWSGTNAHMVVEEAPNRPRAEGERHAPAYAVPVSGRNPEALRQRLRDLAEYASRPGPKPTLADVAYTLSVGRSHFPHRVALVVSSVEELAEHARSASERVASPELQAGAATSSETQAARRLVQELAEGRDAGRVRELLEELSAVYVKGAAVEWGALYAVQRRLRVPLPTYPFLRERYWVPEDEPARAPAERPVIPSLPGAGKVVSQGEEVEFEFRPADRVAGAHFVGGRAIVPGAACVEMVNAASRLLRGGAGIRRLERVIWAEPAAVSDEGLRLRVRLTDGAGARRWVIVSDGEGGETLHASGEYAADTSHADADAALDLAGVRSRCTRTLTGAQVYDFFSARGVRYGDDLRAIESAHVGDGEAVGRIVSHDGGAFAPFDLRLLDASLQVAGLTTEWGLDGDLRVPFSVEAVEVVAPGLRPVYIHARQRPCDDGAKSCYDITAADEKGHTVIRIIGLYTRPLRERKESQARPAQTTPEGVSFFRPRWRRSDHAAPDGEAPDSGHVWVVYGATDFGLADSILACHGGRGTRVRLARAFRGQEGVFEIDLRSAEDYDRLVAAAPNPSEVYFLGGLLDPGRVGLDPASVDVAQEAGVLSLLRLVRTLNRAGLTRQPLALKLVTNDVFRVGSPDQVLPFSAAVAGLGRVISREYPRLRVSVVDVCSRELGPASGGGDACARALRQESPGGPGEVIAYRWGRRYLQALQRIEIPDAAESEPPLRHRGVYLIVGGAGGIGQVLSRHLAAKVSARIALVGRSPLDDAKGRLLEEVTALGGEAAYFQADITDEAAMGRVVATVKQRWGAIHGAVHSALVLRDSSIARMEDEDFHAAFAPKVRGSVVLARVLADESPDWVAWFSSGNALMGNAGQANYVAGCAFQDAWADFLRRAHGRPMHTFNWGYWGEVGAVATPRHAAELARHGVHPIRNDEGLEAFERCLAAGLGQVMPIQAEGRLMESLGADMSEVAALLPAGGTSTFDEIRAALGGYVSDRRGRMDGTLEGLEEVEEWGRDAALVALQEMGGLRPDDSPVEAEALRRRLGVQDSYAGFWRVLLLMLERAGLLVAEGATFGPTPLLKGEAHRRLTTLAERRRDLELRYPEAAPHLRLLAACVAAYPQVLRGERPITDVLFPGSSLQLVESVYKGNRRADYFNNLAAEAVRRAVVGRLGGLKTRREKVRLLEIGAGTGGTSAFVLAALADCGEEIVYDYTDISPSFANHGSRTFGAKYPFLRTRTLDIEKHLAPQGFEPASYDVLLAANVLHATTDMRATMTRVRELARAGATLVLNEGTREQDFATLTFGLTPGWWRFEDQEERSGTGPLLGVTSWRRLLAETGWEQVAAYGTPDAPREDESPQHIIIAENDRFMTRREECAPSARRPVPAPAAEAQAVAPVEAAPAPDRRHAHAALVKHLREVFSEVLRVPGSRIEPREPFESFGADSLVVISIVERLEREFGRLPAAVLFEHITLDALAEYLLANRRAESLAVLRQQTPDAAARPAEYSAEQSANAPFVRRESGRAETDAERQAGVAVTGMSCLYPSAADAQAFWENLRARRDCIGEVPSERRALCGFGTDGPALRGGFIEGVDEFDPLFFNLSPLEAARMDPQERLFLQTAWKAMEDAGYTRRGLRDRGGVSEVGVFVGVMYGEYQCLGAKEWARGNAVEARSGYWSIANRVSHLFNFQGPSLAVDTACSASLTAVHLACESLRRGECEVAIVGGVNLILQPEHHELLRRAGMLSPDGLCRPFGRHARGLVPGEGVAALVLTSLPRALEQGDHIHAVIKGSAVGHGGRTSGYTVPNPNAQARVVSKALASAGVSPRELSYLEAHGTGTPLGDPIEIAGLVKAFSEFTSDREFCAIGSVKSNVGHLEGAAGLAGLMKVILQMRHRQLAPTLYVEETNPEITFSQTPFRIQRACAPWERPTVRENGVDKVIPRRAGVSSFGAGGSVAHVVLEEAPAEQAPRAGRDARRSELILLSAPTREGLIRRAAQLRDYLSGQAGAEVRLEDVAHTLQVGREAFEFRAALAVNDLSELADKLAAFVSGGGAAPSVFTGAAAGFEDDDEEAAALAARLVAKGKLDRLAQLWVGGLAVDWHGLRPQDGRRRIPLPAYSFERRRFWITSSGAEADVARATCEPATAREAAGARMPAPAPQPPPPGDDAQAATRLELQETVRGIVCDVLQLNGEVTPERSFGELGVDSIIAGQLTAELCSRLRLDLKITDLFNHPNVSQLTAFLYEAGPPQIESRTRAPEAEAVATPTAPPEESLQVAPAPERPEAREEGRSAAGPVEAADAVAVVGAAGRFPQAHDLEEFWSLLRQGRNPIGPMPAERLALLRDGGADAAADSSENHGGFLDEIECFDPLFFNISPREAELMDPQQRLFLQEAWKAVEDAGYSDRALAGKKCGVFVGVSSSHYLTVPAVNMEVVGNASSILAARLSYFLDLKGPAVAIDTACSSSLVALHMACRSLLDGEADMALAGGVSCTLIRRSPHSFLRDNGMLSPTAKCHVFDSGADGFVPAEAVGVVVLKRLSDALRDGDRIHGVIRGSGLNQDGRTSGITAPNGRAQTALEEEVYTRSGVNPETIGYVEAHGTGTRLGDPIEVEALTASFRRFTDKVGFCALGSVKSNVGHALAAAGIVGLLKVLLALRFKQIPPNLHYAERNDAINFDGTPFYVASEPLDWPAAGETPRRAAVSSFGFSGTNVHLVVEEAPARAPRRPRARQQHYLMTVSAKREAALRRRCSDLADWIEGRGTGADWADLSWTLNAARSHFPFRRAFVVEDWKELLEQLRRAAAGTDGVRPGPARETAELHRAATRLVNEMRGERAGGRAWAERLSALAELYVSGAEIDWEAFYGGERREPLSLPPYPFEKERCWADAAEGDAERRAPNATLHPLLGRNESTFDEQVFSRRLAQGDWVVDDHVVTGRRVLPAAAYLEMLMAAGRFLSPAEDFTLRNLTWSRPVVVGDAPAEVSVRLRRRPERAAFEVSVTTKAGEGAEPSPHVQGRLAVSRPAADGEATPSPAPLRLEEIRSRCDLHEQQRTIYGRFRELGFAYGEAFVVVQEWWGNGQEAVSRIELPEGVWRRAPGSALHPSILDAAVQTITAVAWRGEEPKEARLPFSLSELRQFAPLERSVYAYVRKERPDTESYDINIVNGRGETLVLLKGLTLRPARAASRTAPVPVEDGTAETAYYRPRWVEQTIVEPDAHVDPLLVLLPDRSAMDERRQVVRRKLGEGVKVAWAVPGSAFRPVGDDIYELDPGSEADYDRLVRALEERGTLPSGIVHLWGWDDARAARGGGSHADELGVGESVRRGAAAVFRLSRALAGRRGGRATRLVYPFRDGGEEAPAHAAVAGFARSIRREDAQCLYQTLRVDEGLELSAALGLALDELTYAAAPPEVSLSHGRRLIRQFEEFSPAPSLLSAPFRERGVYVITGGAGHLAGIVARHLAARFRARLALLSRSEVVAPGGAGRAELESLGGEVLMLRADVAAREQTQTALERVRGHYGRIDGVLHAAGVTMDALVRNKTGEAFDAVLRPKVLGTLWLDWATRDDELDFFVTFSSLAAVVGNPGQADYATANCFMDYFASEREKLVRAGRRRGRSVSINWPLWDAGGMGVSGEVARLFATQFGVRPLDAKEGVSALETVLSNCAEPQVLVVRGERAKFERAFAHAEPPPVPSRTPDAAPGPALQARVERQVIAVVADLMKLRETDIDIDQSMSDYGFDSITLTALSNRLNGVYGLELTPALLFEHPTLRSFLGFLLAGHGPVLRAHYAEIDDTKPAETSRPPSFVVEEAQAPSAAPPHHEAGSDDIAVIGMQGVFPRSPDLKEFWHNLEVGRDMVADINRFDWPPPDEEGKDRWPRRAGLIANVDKFDAEFFRISPREAELMDPQQRIFLQTAWATFEDAGYAPSSLTGTATGVFVGVSTHDYAQLLTQYSDGGGHALTGLASCLIPNRLSYLLDLRGPSEAIDTACSSSLVALHRAVESLRRGECSLALVGGVNVLLSPTPFIAFSKAGMLSPDGKCRPLDSRANGYVRGEGAGAVLLKPLGRALADGDSIRAVIRGTAIGHGGRANQLTAPNPYAQAEVVIKAHEQARVDPRSVGYVELHGTGTELGDPVEVNGLTRAFRTLAERRGAGADLSASAPFCGVGSVKSNIGHLEPAAGIAGLVKVILALRHKRLPATIHFEQINPYIDLAGTPFYVVTRTADWEAPRDEAGHPLPRRAGISSFGFGGVNAHAVLEEAPPPPPRPDGGEELVLISARDEGRLREYVGRWLDFLGEAARAEGAPSLRDLAHTSRVGRDQLTCRLAVLATSLEDLAEKMRRFLASGADGEGISSGRRARGQAGYGSAGASDGSELLRAGGLHELARRWVAGEDFDWGTARVGEDYMRVPLPTYPFARQSHWYDPARVPLEPDADARAPAPAEDGEWEQVRRLLEEARRGGLRPEELEEMIVFEPRSALT